MKTFDYKSAWREVAMPAYKALPEQVRSLVAQVATDAADLHQSPDLSMPWPDTDLKQKFEALADDTLAFASRIIYDCGHWFPTGGELNLPGREKGCHWKFSHYADQILRARLLVSGETPFQIHEGAIRLCYASRNAWQWEEIAPATPEGLKIAQGECASRDKALAGLSGDKRDGAAYRWYEQLKLRIEWPANWQLFMMTGNQFNITLAHYMREEQEIEAAIPPTGKDRQRIIKDCERTIQEATQERDGLVWLIDHGLHVGNTIYYPHDDIFCFGWREPVTDGIRDAILAVISEFPFAYRIKCADGKTLEGGIS